MNLLHAKMLANAPTMLECVKRLAKKKWMILAPVTINSMLRGARGLPILATDVSTVHPKKGVAIRGKYIPELCELGTLSTYWLALTGELPNSSELAELEATFAKYSKLPVHVETALRDAVSVGPDDEKPAPMDLFVQGLAMFAANSEFRKAYATKAERPKPKKGAVDEHMVKAAVTDAVKMSATAQALGAFIYRLLYHDGKVGAVPEGIKENVWGTRLAAMMGLTHKHAGAVLEIAGTTHMDHSKGNVSSHTAHLVHSADADPYLSCAAASAALAGPSHGRAAQEVMDMIDEFMKSCDNNPTKELTRKFMEDRLAKGLSIFGLGHAVLRWVDSRFTMMKSVAEKLGLVGKAFQVSIWMNELGPEVLKKAECPHANTDLGSGALYTEVGIKERAFYTVIFAMSRIMGWSAQYSEDVIWGGAIERPSSLTTDAVLQRAAAFLKKFPIVGRYLNWRMKKEIEK